MIALSDMCSKVETFDTSNRTRVVTFLILSRESYLDTETVRRSKTDLLKQAARNNEYELWDLLYADVATDVRKGLLGYPNAEEGKRRLRALLRLLDNPRP